MKKIFNSISVFAFSLIAIMLVVPMFGQDSPTQVVEAIKNAQDPLQLFSLTTVVTALVISFAGYLAPFIPVIKEIPSTTFQVAVFAVLIVIGGITFGWVNIWQAAFGYFISTNLYTHVLKWMVKTPKSEAALKR